MKTRGLFVCVAGVLACALAQAPLYAVNSREPRELQVWRMLAENDRLKVAQVLVPERVYPEDRLVYPDERRPADLRAARGQHESLQFSVEFAQTEDVMRLGVAVGALRDDAGNELDQLRVYETIYLTTHTPSNEGVHPVGHWPDPLFETDWPERIPNAAITARNTEIMKAAQRRTFWVTVKVPRDASPGTYRGEVALTLGDQRSATFGVELRVDPIVLPQRPAFQPFTGTRGWRGARADSWDTLGLSDEESAAIREGAMDQYRAWILEYGWTPTIFWGLSDWQRWHDYGRGATTFTVGARGREEAEAWLREQGLMQYAWTYIDPYGGGEHVVAELAEAARAWKQQSEVPTIGRYSGENVEPLFEVIDIWARQDPRSAHWGEPTGPLGWGHKAWALKQAGARFVSFTHVRHIEHEPIAARAEFWDDFAIGFTGRYIHSSARWSADVYEGVWTGGNGWNEERGGTGNYVGTAIYPGPHGITTSIRLETLRDGVYDFDYLVLLREALEARQASGAASDETATQAIAQAQAIIGDLELGQRVGTAEELHAMRAKVADLILAMGR